MSLVVPGISEIIDISLFESKLSKEDFPTLGSPLILKICNIIKKTNK